MHRGGGIARLAFPFVLLTSSGFAGSLLFATSVIPISDAELYRRADVIVHGVVASSDVTADNLGRPETLTVIEPLAVLKGRLTGNLILHQSGGRLPDGRFFQLWGRPEYVPGREVIVFAIARPEGDYQTAEMLLGKFEVWQDEKGNRFALPDLTRGIRPGVILRRDLGDSGEKVSEPRLLSRFLDFLRDGGRSAADVTGTPVGELAPVLHPKEAGQKGPLWGNIGGLWRWNNGATDAWRLDGMANMTGGGIAEATNALATWTNDPTSVINYTVGGGPDPIHLNVSSNSSCGWSTCLSGGGVIACGGPSGVGMNLWRGESYTTITNGEVWLRAFCGFNEFTSTIVQSVIEHELGHTLGLGHSDQDVSPHDICRGDENLAIMRSTAQDRTSLGTDDRDAIRWLYGDGLNSCPPTVTAVSPTFGSVAGGTRVTGVGTNFQTGAAVAFGSLAATAVTVVNSKTITVTTGAHGAGAVDVVVTNVDAQSGTLASGFLYGIGIAFFTVTPCRVIDTRNLNGPYGGPALAAGADRTFTIGRQCGIPANARSVAVNLAVTQSTSGPGHLTVYQGGTNLPVAATINYSAGQTRANNAVVPLGAAGDIRVHCGQGSGTVHLIVDVNGYFQ
ncbi:MAG TPA: IPT/TIG domain-containing protein [Thermoanaerobaculia bacterium]|nr:IPT/TIG domain-containing protein [Thermoanaerobaculia bacterium]